MRERATLIGDMVDLRDVIDRLITNLSSTELFDNNREINFSPLFEREFQEHRHWPPADKNTSRLKWEDRASLAAQTMDFELTGRVLEYTSGPVPVISECFDCEAEVVLDGEYKFDVNDAVIHKSFQTVEGEFDFVVVHESLSFCREPAVIMSQLRSRLKPDGKLILRVRPWTAPAGGFQESYHNWAYAHLLQDLAHNDLVKWRVLQPLKEYDRLITNCGFISITRQVCSVPLVVYLQEECEAFEILKERTWGEFDNNEARAILPIRHIDYVLAVS